MMFLSIFNNSIWTAEALLYDRSANFTQMMDKSLSCASIYSIDVLKDLINFVTSNDDSEECCSTNYDETDDKSISGKQPRYLVKKTFENFDHEFCAFNRFLSRIFSDILPHLLKEINNQDDILKNIREKFVEFAKYGYGKFEEAKEFIINVEERWFFKSHVDNLNQKIEDSIENLDKHFFVLFCGYAKDFKKKLQIGQREEIISEMSKVLVSLKAEYESVKSNIQTLPEKYGCYYSEEITGIEMLLKQYGEK